MNVAILFDAVDARPTTTADERGVMEAVDATEAALQRSGHRTARVPVDEPGGDWIQALIAMDAQLAFNLCEGAGGSSANEPRVAAVVELLGLPLTGSTSETLAFARRKDRVNATLGAAGLPIPPWTVIDAASQAVDWTDFPAIVKPVAEDASIGITQRSVARNGEELRTAIVDAADHLPLLVQRFLTGREINVGVLGEDVLPLSEIDFGTFPASSWRLVSYRAKWETGSDEDRGTSPCCPAVLDDELAASARQLAVEAWQRVSGTGYGRVDLRADERERLYILEVNPNPDLAPSAGFARMAAAAGYEYVELVDRIVLEAMK
jgi:D-alanine-D-alanine ligase